ncbi:hypothetical protein CFD26_100972 [Aspergillus turcosus]|uniref:Uncharacterized protein n=1 Tax=Aspergillus turcosus TaxID=1245748 RepID=A0A3R7J366_9EURO|nr:hypothetical protein CFD26_100972 [Aspergillus turcosus]
MDPLSIGIPQQLVFSIRTNFHDDHEPPLRAIIDERLEGNIISHKCRRSLQQFPLKSFPLNPKRHIRDSYGTWHILTEEVELEIRRDGSDDTEEDWEDWFLVSLADNLGPSDAYDVILGGKWKNKFTNNRLKDFRAATRERAGAPSLPEEEETRKGKEPIHRMSLNMAVRLGSDQLSGLIAVEPGVHLDSNMLLRTSFEMMLMITAVEYPLMVDSGLILMGYSTALVPMKANNDFIVWHLEVAEHDQQLTVAELVATKAEWLKLDDLNQLRHRQALLGWCPNATMTLGTNLIDIKAVGWSDAAPKKTTWHWAGANLQLLAQSAAPLQIGGQLGISMERRVNLLRFSPLNNYLKCLGSSAAEQIILYDLTTRRAWLVPLLAAFHHMLTAYWKSIPENCRQSPVPQANPSPQCDLVLRELLKENGNLVIETSPSDKCTMRDLIMGFSVNMSKVSIHPPRGSEVYGYEFMDIVMDSPLADLKRRKVEKQGLGWTLLLSEVRCLFCSNIGDVIIGGRANEPSAPCNRLIEGCDLLAATMRSIELLSERAGIRQSATAPICRLSAKHTWLPTGDPFTKCNHNDRSQSTCWNMMDFTQEVQAETPGDSRPNSNTVRLCQDGAVVFGRRQAQIRFGRRAFENIYNTTAGALRAG